MKRKRPYEALYLTFKKEAQRTDRSKPHKVLLTYEQFLKLTETTECHYCGDPIQWTKFNLSKNSQASNLDRKDSAGDYTQSNVVVCCSRCNWGKSDKFSYQEWVVVGKALKFSRKQPSKLELALQFSLASHANQSDKGNQPYILHPICVSLIIRKEFTTYPEKLPAGITLEDLMVSGLLHDVVEDCGVTLNEIEEKFGPMVREIVDGVTRRVTPKKEVYIDYIRRAKKHPGSRIVKIADLHHNMSRISNLPLAEQNILQRYLRAERILNDVE